jgi:exodeoxyribonuclease III
VRLATWNVNSVKARLPRLLEWLAETGPDVVGLQETKVATALFPAADVEKLGYEVAAHGDGRWNGVALLSRVGLEHVSRGFPGEPGYEGEPGEALLLDEPGLRKPETRAIGADCGGIRVWSLYAPNGRTPDSAHYACAARSRPNSRRSPRWWRSVISTSHRPTPTCGTRRCLSARPTSPRPNGRRWPIFAVSGCATWCRLR